MTNAAYMYGGRARDTVARGTTGVSIGIRVPVPASSRRAMIEGQARTLDHFRLVDAQGRYLHMGEFDHFVSDPRDGWIGNGAQLERLRARFPQTRSLRPVRVPRDPAGAVLHSRRP